MISDKRVIAVIPARGGSKGIPRKNLQNYKGRSLLEWAILTSKETREVDRTIVSTDNSEIASLALSLGAEVYLRPDHLAGDQSLVVETIRSLRDVLRVENEQADIFTLLQPTSPNRPAGLVSKCLKQLIDSKSDSLATFSELTSSPERIWMIDSDVPYPLIKGSNPWLPRQSLKVGFELNGAVYAFYPGKLPENSQGLLFGKSFAYVMQEKVLDIDTLADLRLANELKQFRDT